jgi:indolepyruvate ferredoxin oxidoreductase
MPIDPRFLAADAREVFTGSELLVKGALETEGGIPLLTGYPGSPVAGFFDTLGDLKDLLKPKGVRAYQANNEALAVASVNGAQMVGCRAMAVFKSVGGHVAADALALGNMAGAHPQGGAVMVFGEDPWCESTQVPADSRFLCEHLRMPVIEPGGPQEVKDWVGLSFKLSQVAGLYIGYIITVAQADGGGTVYCRANHFPAINTQQRLTLDTAQINLDKVLLPPRTWQHELQIPERFAKTIQAARELGINRIAGAAHGSPFGQSKSGEACLAPTGFIVTGMAGPFLRHVLAEVGLTGIFPVLQMGMSYPVDTELVRQFAGMCRTMIVVEERRSFLEKNIRESLFQHLPQAEAAEIASRLFGKVFPGEVEGIPAARGLNYSVLAQKLIPLLRQTEGLPEALRNGKLNEELQRLAAASRPKLEVLTEKLIPRTPTFCPGCPHRDSAATLLELRKNLADPTYMKQHHGKGPIDLVAHGDTGCYTMLMFPPTEQLMHNYSGMGLGGGTGSGIDPFITNKQIVFMGDGTFFHSGMLGISNSIKASQDITYIILANGTTAMTGHQEHAGTDEDLLGNEHYVQDIEAIVRGMAANAPLKIVRLSPADRPRYRRTLEETILSDGVKIVIADKECGITHHRAQLREERRIVKQKGYLPNKTHMNVTPEVCEHCLECTKQTACPGLTIVETDYGRKLDTDLTWCVNDGACERVTVSNPFGTDIKPCPSFEEVTIVHNHRRRYTLPNLSLDKLPDPQHTIHDMSQPGSTWRVHMAGVGGMGIGTVAAILVRAGHKEGFHVLFADRKGLAIRNGGVYSQITFMKDEAERHEGTKARRHEVGDEEAGISAEAQSPRVPSAFSPTSCLRASVPSCLSNSTPSIPYGRADLLLGVDILEAARAIDPREQYRVASRDRTCAVLNLYKQPTVFTLLGRQDFDPEIMRQEIFSQCRDEHSYAKNLSEICEQRLGSKQFVNIMMLGVAYQLGLIPVSAHSIAWAIKDTIRREHRKNLKAFNIGRKLALEPRALPLKPQPGTWEQLLTNKTRILRKSRLFGQVWSQRFEHLVHSAMKQMRELSAESKYDLALRIYDLLQYGDHRLARTYIELVRNVYKRDSRQRHFAATAAAIWNLAKVMLIKDEPYVAYLLTRYEKKQRDLAKYGVDVANGDRLVYKHHTNPELVIGRYRLRFKITTRDWMLKLVRQCKWLRRLPGWHARETQFRDWYIALLLRVDLEAEESYAQGLKALRCPEEVSGYREVRYPKMEQARATAEAALGRGALDEKVDAEEIVA